MDSSELQRIEKRARWRYELSRLRRAVFGLAPLLVVIGVACFFAHRPGSTLVCGVAAFAAALIMLWYGRDPQKAVLPGVLAGMIPLVFALCVNRIHGCQMNGCASVCVPACTAGGIFAGAIIAAVGIRRKANWRFWLAASTLALLVGAMGCVCVDYAGIAGLAIGFAVGMTASLLPRREAKDPS